jgi:predicted metalloprotease with PDZ domain
MSAPLRYTLRFPGAATNYVDVELVLPEGGPHELMMAVWTPGSYMVREYARHVEGVVARDGAGNSVGVDKVTKNRWRLAKASGEIVVRYRVYGHELTVRNNWIESDFAILNGAPTFLSLVGAAARPHDVRVELPRHWRTVVTALPGTGPNTFRADSYDTLVDSPLLCGNPDVRELEVKEKPHVFATIGDGGLWDLDKAAADVQRLASTIADFWGVVPYDRYVFINALTEGRGGLEHKSSTVMMASRWAGRVRKDYIDWLGLVSHEFFHVWNGKRLRPQELGPFDYENEAYTPDLWVVEGCTAYYDDLLVRRAGLSTAEEYLERLGKAIEQLQTTPGRLVQPIVTASRDAWIKHYRPDENTTNTAISYYIKGSIIAWLLDARLRIASSGKASLDDVMRRAYERHSGARGYSPEQFRALVEEVAGTKLGALFDEALASTGELDYTEALATFGLAFKQAKREEDTKGYLGVSTRNDAGRLVVTQVVRDAPGFVAGVNADDELVAIDDFRVTPADWDKRLEQYTPGAEVSLTVARRQKLIRLPVALGKKPERDWKLEIDKDASVGAVATRQAWLGG